MKSSVKPSTKPVLSTRTETNHSNQSTLFRHVKYEHLVAGVTGGVTSTLLLHPLDLLKIRFAGKFHSPHLLSTRLTFKWCFLARVSRITNHEHAVFKNSTVIGS